MNSEKDKLSRSDVSQISPVSAKTQQSKENNAASPVPKRRRHYYTAFPGEKAPEVTGAFVESKPEEKKTEEKKTEEKKSTEKKPAEQKPAEQKPTEQKPTEQKPAEQKPVEQKPVEQKPAEKKKPVEQKPAKQKPAEQKPTEKKKPVEQKPAKQKPAKQKPAKQISAKQLSEDFKPAGPIEPDEASDDYYYPDDYNPDPPNKKAMTAAVAAASVIAAAVLGFLIFLIISNMISEKSEVSTADSAVDSTAAASTQTLTENSAAKTVIMPDLSGMSEAEAYRILNDAGIKYKVARVFSESVAFNRVVSQFPVSGTEVSLQEEATLYLSKGKENEIIESSTKPGSTSSTEPKTTEPKTTGQQSTASSYDGDYILSDSASRKLTLSDISDLDRDTLNLALNEIFARHGRKFTDPDISAYFKSKSWYNGTIASKDFDMSILNKYETYNVNFISNYQTEKGYR